MKFFGLATGGGMFDGVFKTMKRNVGSWGGVWAGPLGVPHYDALTPKYRPRRGSSCAASMWVIKEAAYGQKQPGSRHH